MGSVSLLLDTTVLIDHLRGHEPALALLRRSARPVASEITRAEVLQGLRSAERRPAERLFENVDWRPVDEPVARVAGRLGREYRRSHALGVADLCVAATAEVLGLPLADRERPALPDVRGAPGRLLRRQTRVRAVSMSSTARTSR